MEIEKREFEGNILVTISDSEVRLWVCNKEGQNIFRFKTVGKVYKSLNSLEQQDVTVMSGNTEYHSVN